MRLRLVLPFAAAVAVAAGCGGEDDGQAGEVRVVATTPQAAAIAEAVGGERVGVRQLLSNGADPHSFEPRPSDVRALAVADLVVRSGGDVDRWLDGVGDAESREVFSLLDAARPKQHDGRVDPHWWHDPARAADAASALSERLAGADPGGAAGYRRRVAAFAARLGRLDARIRRCVQSVPPARRKLVTAHPSLGYFADHYGLEVVGTTIPSSSGQAQPSAGGTRRLVQRIRDEQISAVFPEVGLDNRLEEAVAREGGATLGEPLYVDTLGPPDSPASTYLGALEQNADRIVRGLTDGRRGCAAG